MGESITDIPCLQQSVSFGRFERDSLSWERWSTFPTNKYLEEVEKYSTPGSVAQKKAYFEAHYKKIAARRAELLLDQERDREAELVDSDDVGFTSTFDDTVEAELDYGKRDTDNEGGSFDGDVSIEHVYMKSHSTDNFYQENEVACFDDEVSVEHIDDMVNLENEIGSFDGDVGVEHIMPNQENVMVSFDDDVNVEHMNNNSADLLNLENEVGSFDGEHFHAKGGSIDGFSHETVVSDAPSEMSGHDDGTLTVNAVGDLLNIVSEKFEDVVAFTDDDSTVNDAREVLKMEVAKDIHELKDDADIIEVTEYFDKKPREEIVSEATEYFDKEGEVTEYPIREMSKSKKSFSAIEDAPSTLESKGEELPQEKVKRTIIEEESGNLMKLVTPKKIQKATLVKKITSTPDTKKKPASPVPKRTTTLMHRSPMLSTPKSSKPEVTIVAKSASRLLDKKDNSFTPSTNKKTIGSQMKKPVPTSLHMSLSLGPLNSDPASLTMRKSLIMETMADKDIVKRAFKAFRNAPQISPAASQPVSRKAEQKGSPGNTTSKKIEGSGWAAKVASSPTRSGQQGTRKTLLSPSVNNKSGAQRNMKSVAASFGPRVQLQKNNQTMVSKEVESQTTYLEAKLKVEKIVQPKKASSGITSKPKVRSSYNLIQGGTVYKINGEAQSSSWMELSTSS